MSNLNPESLRKAADEWLDAAAKKGLFEKHAGHGALPGIIVGCLERGIRAYLAAEAERGWAMRPREATDAMLDGGWAVDRIDETEDRLPLNPGWTESINEIWTAMWDAAAKDPAHD